MADAILKNEVCADPEAMKDKQKVMSRMWWNSLLYSVSDTLKVIASVLTPVGLGVLLPEIVKGAQNGTGLIASIQGAPTVTLAIAGISLATTFLAITVGFASSRLYHSGNFDALEVNAQHTAKYLVKELKKETKEPVVEHSQNCRADGQKWSSVVRPGSQPTIQQV